MSSLADWVAYSLFALNPVSRLGQAVHFFIYDSLKIFLLLSVVMFGVTLLRSFLDPAKAKRWLAERHAGIGYVGASLLGVVTPFCSCSAVPLFIGFVEAGIPLGMTFSFLVASPMVNEVALILLAGLFGWKIAAIYLFSGLTVAMVSGITIGRIHMESGLQPEVFQVARKDWKSWTPTRGDRLRYARDYTFDLLKKIGPYVLVGIGIGGWIHGYAPAEFLVRYAGRDNPFAVPLAVLIGVPLYSNAGGAVPIVQALMGKGLPTGTALAFMMAVTALSLPEAILLKKVLRPRLLVLFFGIVAVSIVLVGYLFNAIL